MLPPDSARRLIAPTVLLLALLGGFMPLRWLAWENAFGRLAQVFVAPIAQPLAVVSRWVAGPGNPVRDDDEIRRLNATIEEYRQEYLRVLAENDRLRQVIRDLQDGQSWPGAGPIRQVFAAVYGSASDVASGLLSIRAGEAEGVNVNTVAVGVGGQLVGRVVAAGGKTSTVQPITMKKAGPVGAVVIIDRGVNGLLCTLEPVGDGTLRGPVEDRRDPTTSQPILPEVGMAVRLRDEGRWPASAQLLLIGRVERVEDAPDQPLRKVIIVKPTIERLERVSEVILRVPANPDPREREYDGGRR